MQLYVWETLNGKEGIEVYVAINYIRTFLLRTMSDQ